MYSLGHTPDVKGVAFPCSPSLLAPHAIKASTYSVINIPLRLVGKALTHGPQFLLEAVCTELVQVQADGELDVLWCAMNT